MAYTKREHEINYDQVAAYLKDAVNKVKTQEDPDVLNNLKKVFKKNVPLTLRGYVTAYLLKYARIPYHFGNENRTNNKKNDFRRERTDFRKTERPAENQERTSRPQLDPSMTTTIFVSIGRNRRVFPRDLVGLICSVVGLDRDRIGEIRVLANYSFVQLLSEDAEKAINTLNGYNYRGRPLSVSFSKMKDDAADDNNEAVTTESENFERVPSDVENVSTQVQDSFTKENADTVAEQAAFAAQQAAYTEPTAEEIAAARAPRSSSSDTAEAAPAEE